MQLHQKQSHRKQWRHDSFHNTDDTIDHRRFSRQTQEAPGWTLPVSTQAGLRDAVTVIRTVLLNAAAP